MRTSNGVRVFRLSPSLVLPLALALTLPAAALEPGKANGTLTVDGAATKLGFATSATAENLFDDSRKDTIVVLSDRPLGDVSPTDDVTLHLQAREGKLSALALRIDGTKLVNVAVHSARVDGVVLLPGTWFSYKPGAPGSGTLGLAAHDWEGHGYACTADFTAVAFKPVHSAGAAAPPPSPVEPTPTLPPASTSAIAPDAMAALLVNAMMSKDEDQAITLVESGADPNLRDQYGIPVLNWAVMTCMPRLVQTLVDRGADLRYERAPGMTILTEAGACPAAAKILRAAGAK